MAHGGEVASVGNGRDDKDQNRYAYISAQHSYMGGHFDLVRRRSIALSPTTT